MSKPTAAYFIFAVLIATGVSSPCAAGAPPTPAEINQARAMAAAIIDNTQAQGAFENVTRSTYPVVRHTQSGLYCMFDNKNPGEIVVTPDAQGGGVVCNEGFGFFNRVVTARPAADGLTAAQVLAAALDRQAHDSGAFRRIGKPQYVMTPAAASHIGHDPEAWLISGDGKTLEHLVVRVQNGWVYTARLRAGGLVFEILFEGGLDVWIDDLLRDPQGPPANP